MKKTIIYLVLLLILGVAVWYYLFKENSLFSAKEAAFTVKDTANIQKIFLSDKAGNAVKLTREENGWKVNDKYAVLPYTINNLLSTLHNQHAQSPVVEKLHNEVIRNMAGESIKVELYDKKNKKIRTFYVGGEGTDGNGTYMLMEGAERPYVVTVRTFNGYLTPRYTTDESQWRDRSVFNIAAEDIAAVSVRYAVDTLNSFTILQTEPGKYEIKMDERLQFNKPLNEQRVKDFLGFFKNLNSEGYITDIPDMAQVLSVVPMRGIITVTDRKGTTKTLHAYWRPVDRRSKNVNMPDHLTPEGYDADRMYGVYNTTDTISLQQLIFEKLFRKSYEFFEYTSPAKDTVKIDDVMIKN